MGLIKIFSGSEILAQALKVRIEEAGVSTVVKNNIQSARLGGFGNTDLAVEIFVQESDYGKISGIIDDFRMSI